MKNNEISALLDTIRPTITDIEDLKLKSSVEILLNLVEFLYSKTQEQQKEIQDLKDEINRLKGEQGKPDIKSNNSSKPNTSSEKERKALEKNKTRKPKRKKKSNLKIDKKVKCTVDKSILPDDAIFKGYAELIVQDIKIEPFNIKYLREIYYSPSSHKTYSGDLPSGYKGDFSPKVKALVLSLYHDSKMTEPTIASFLNTHGLLISESKVVNILTSEFVDDFSKEKLELVHRGLKSSEYQHIDDTVTRINGKNHYTHILCNNLYTAYFTEEKKDRLTVIKILGEGNSTFRLDDTAYLIMSKLHVSEKWINILKNKDQNINFSEEDFNCLMKSIFPNKNKYPNIQLRIKEACAISAYRNKTDIMPVLVCDDAPQFKQITEEIALCWIHEGRHYKKLNPVFSWHREILEKFNVEFWSYYSQLLDYKESPSEKKKCRLKERFDEIFTRKTSYNDLDERIEKTYRHKNELLMVLKYPNLPLHNNPAEHEVRPQKRRQDISFQTRTNSGTSAKDIFMTIIQTSKKLGVNSYEYLVDRISQTYQMASLADLVEARSV